MPLQWYTPVFDKSTVWEPNLASSGDPPLKLGWVQVGHYYILHQLCGHGHIVEVLHHVQ